MTGNEYTDYAKEIERIEGLTFDTICKMSAQNIWRLTNNFTEHLVRMIFAKTERIDKQKSLCGFLINAYKEEWNIHKYPTLSPDPPSYLDDFCFEIECNRLITEDGTATVPLSPEFFRDINLALSSSRDPKEEITVRTKNRLSEARPKELEAQQRQLEEAQQRVKELEKENTGLKRLLQEETEEIRLADKVRLEFLLRLMQKDGADLDDYGNKANAAKVIKLVSGLPLSTCKNYCTHRDLNTKFHAESILSLNNVLKELEMETRL